MHNNINAISRNIHQGCRGNGISIPIPTPYTYTWGAPYPRQTCHTYTCQLSIFHDRLPSFSYTVYRFTYSAAVTQHYNYTSYVNGVFDAYLKRTRSYHLCETYVQSKNPEVKLEMILFQILTWAFGATWKQASEAKYNSTFVLLDYLCRRHIK